MNIAENRGKCEIHRLLVHWGAQRMEEMASSMWKGDQAGYGGEAYGTYFLIFLLDLSLVGVRDDAKLRIYLGGVGGLEGVEKGRTGAVGGGRMSLTT